MQFREEIYATVGQLVKELEHHLEEHPQIVSEFLYIDDDLISIIYIDHCSKDYQGNLIDYVGLEIAHDQKGMTVGQLLDALKAIDANAVVLVDYGSEYNGETDSGLRNMVPDVDGSFILCEENESGFCVSGISEYSEIDCLSGTFHK